MNKILTLLLLATVGGLIGWFTNILAIKLLFRPINPIKIPLLNIEILGLIPKRKKEIAENIGQVVATELLSIDDLINEALKEDDKAQFINHIIEKLKAVINEKLNFIPAPFKMMAQPYIEKLFDEEVVNIIEDIGYDSLLKLKEKIDIEKIVRDKVDNLDLQELERIIISVAKKELKHIEILGLILGLIIGLIQGLFILFLQK
jgi:uncharacterized membrane protein YheB (UPF0754 family)